LGESQGSVFGVTGGNEVDVWDNVVIDFENWSESGSWRVIWWDSLGDFVSSQSNEGSVSITVSSVVIQIGDSAARRPSDSESSSISISVGSSPLDDDEIEGSVDFSD